ncbi:MAG: Uma2 family endonuclease [Gemmatimonadota bacterium]
MPMAAATKRWTLDEFHALPDDGRKCELVRGELFVTPAPAWKHEVILARLARILDPYVEHEHLGFVFHRAVIQIGDSEVEPDLTVQQNPSDDLQWASAPTPSLVVEVLSTPTKRRDENEKRDIYMDAGVGEYWMIDPRHIERGLSGPRLLSRLAEPITVSLVNPLNPRSMCRCNRAIDTCETLRSIP